MKDITNKSNVMLNIEEKFGESLEELLRRKYVDDHYPIIELAEELRVSYPTIIRWLKQAGIYSRKLKTLYYSKL